jgi:hypothetical protein
MRIDSYSFGSIVVDGKSYASDVIIFRDRVLSWWRKDGHSLHIDDLEEVIKEKPKFLIIGTGSSGLVNVPEELVKELSSEIQVFVEPTGRAVERFNGMQGEDVVAALHLTC